LKNKLTSAPILGIPQDEGKYKYKASRKFFCTPSFVQLLLEAFWEGVKADPQTSFSGEVVLMQWGVNPPQAPPRQIEHWGAVSESDHFLQGTVLG